MKAKGKWATRERAVVTLLRQGLAEVRANGVAESKWTPLRGVYIQLHKALQKSVTDLDTSAPWDRHAPDRAAEDARAEASLWRRWLDGKETGEERLAIWGHALARESAIKPTQSERLKWAEAEIDRLEALVKKLQAKKP